MSIAWIVAIYAIESCVGSGNSGVRFEVSYHTSQINELTNRMDHDEVRAEQYPEVSFLRTFNSSSGGGSERSGDVCGSVNVVSILKFDATLQILHGFVYTALPHWRSGICW